MVGLDFTGESNFGNLPTLLETMSVFFKANGKPDPFVRNASGKFKIPGTLTPGYDWIAVDPACNYHVMRIDVYGAWSLLREIMSFGGPKKFSSVGRRVAKVKPGWKNLSAADFQRIFKANAQQNLLNDTEIMVLGAKLKLFKA